MRLVICVANSENNPATSCKEIHGCNPTAPSGYYWVNTTTGPLQLYCQTETYNCGDAAGGWMRAAYINMTNVSDTCPMGLTYTVVSSTRMCTRSHTSYTGCFSVIFPTHGVPYTKVCGRARWYQYWSTNAFYNYYYEHQTTLDSSYASGVSVTYGSPRNHIWTFAVGRSKDTSYPGNCPCATLPDPAAPHLWEKTILASQGTLGNLKASGLWLILCGSHWGVQGGALAVIVVDHGSLKHWARKWVMTLKWGFAILITMCMKTLEWINLRYSSTESKTLINTAKSCSKLITVAVL